MDGGKPHAGRLGGPAGKDTRLGGLRRRSYLREHGAVGPPRGRAPPAAEGHSRHAPTAGRPGAAHGIAASNSCRPLGALPRAATWRADRPVVQRATSPGSMIKLRASTARRRGGRHPGTGAGRRMLGSGPWCCGARAAAPRASRAWGGPARGLDGGRRDGAAGAGRPPRLQGAARGRQWSTVLDSGCRGRGAAERRACRPRA